MPYLWNRVSRSSPAEAAGSDSPDTAGASTLNRTTVCPPEREHTAWPWRGHLRNWLNAGWEAGQSQRTSGDRPLLPPRSAKVIELQAEFESLVSDVRADIAEDLLGLVERARSPRELWHLRPRLYDLIARVHTEAQAQRRLEQLNRHFPTRERAARPGSSG
jgi:hypothetical protein